MHLFLQQLSVTNLSGFITVALFLVPFIFGWLVEDRVITKLIKINDSAYRKIYNELIPTSRELVLWIIGLAVGVRIFSYIMICIAKFNNIIIYFVNIMIVVGSIMSVISFMIYTIKEKNLLLRASICIFILLFFISDSINMLSRINEINIITHSEIYKGNIFIINGYLIYLRPMFSFLIVCTLIIYIIWIFKFIKYQRIFRNSRSNIHVSLHTTDLNFENIPIKEIHKGIRWVDIVLENDNMGYIIPVNDIKLKEYKYINRTL